MNFKGIVKGLHHVTATVNDAQEDYDFYTKVLGLRLVKETVNFDNEKVFHFYYANGSGLPSTVFTTFPYKGQGVQAGVIGNGQASHTAFSVPSTSLPFWKDRLSRFGVEIAESMLFGWPLLEFNDPAGLNLQLVGAVEDPREPVWENGQISHQQGIRGIHHVILSISDAAETKKFLGMFGYEVQMEAGDLTLFAAGEGRPGDLVIVKSAPGGTRGVNGLGTVHHVAHRVDNLEDSLHIKAYLEDTVGLQVTEVMDRKYFKSIYFRIPGGVLFEVATSGPGFMVDESLEMLGSALKLPDWQEPNRERIEENLLQYKK